MRSFSGIILFFLLVLAVDWYFFSVLRFLCKKQNKTRKKILYTAYWVITLCAFFYFVYLFSQAGNRAKLQEQVYFIFAAITLFLGKITGILFFILDDIRRFSLFMGRKVFKKSVSLNPEGEKISRSQFLSWAGMMAGGGVAGALLYGFNNKYKYTLHRVALNYPGLPHSVKGLKAVQISDIHSGSFDNKAAVEKGVHLILEQKPDIIFFTGDLVNYTVDEMDNYIDLFSKLQAPLGVFSVLGNHDYGDYVRWNSAEEKVLHFEKMKQLHARLGWKLLLNEHVLLSRNQDTLAIAGVENWSARSQFRRYGNLKKAYRSAEHAGFKILLSHDPSHWRAEVLPDFPDIDLTLSGHTHGMQFGVETPGLRWSPVQYVYKEWAGLYENISSGKKTQKLYVNRGFGFIGYPGRLGILPEITVLEFDS
ncbi:MAG: metallophosphoesterase [Chitinophagaceae bacterium]|nr:metallophosphoesterase [Chitinophagaceae bacterium]